MRSTLSALAILIALASGPLFGATVLYDVDFSSPPNVVGASPVTGFGPVPRFVPTSEHAGRVDSTPAGLAGQYLSLQPKAASSAGVSFWLGAGDNPRSADPGLGESFPAYVVEMDVLIQAILAGPLPGDDADFKIQLNAPLSHQLRFTHDGGIRAITFEKDGISETLVGTYVREVPLHVRMIADLQNDNWSIEFNGKRAFAGAFPNDGSIWDVDVLLNRGSLIASAAIDNLQITGLPDPSVGLLVLFGLPLAGRAIRRSRS